MRCLKLTVHHSSRAGPQTCHISLSSVSSTADSCCGRFPRIFCRCSSKDVVDISRRCGFPGSVRAGYQNAVPSYRGAMIPLHRFGTSTPNSDTSEENSSLVCFENRRYKMFSCSEFHPKCKMQCAAQSSTRFPLPSQMHVCTCTFSDAILSSKLQRDHGCIG